MRPRRIENKDELLSGSDKKERRYIKDIMMSYGIFDRENNGIISAMFSSINSCNISNPSINKRRKKTATLQKKRTEHRQ